MTKSYIQQYTSALTLTVIALSGLSSVCFANDFDLRISDDALHANLAVIDEYSELKYGMGYFYKDADESINVVNVDFQSQGQTAMGNLPTTVGLGIQGNYFKEDNIKGSAIGIGGNVRVNLPSAPGVSIESEAHFAPDVLAFSDAKSFARFRAQANYRIIRTADISAGYRYLHTKLTSGRKRTLESGLFLGLKIKF
ncbi:MAG: hypothetical protein C9356_16025 [Oleiphilus sp.]|nr:MAG: hypothetical protein C9356_16025 [Oleiphilus sp.]